MSHPLYKLLQELEATSTHFTLGRHRENSILVVITMVGERVEVDVFEDGHMEVARFPGSEAIVGDETLVYRLITEHQEGAA